MPHLTRDHTGPYAAPDVDPPCWDDEPEPDAELVASEFAEGEQEGRKAFAAGQRINPYSRARDVYAEARRDGWSRGWDLQEHDEYERAADTVSVAELKLARAA